MSCARVKRVCGSVCAALVHVWSAKQWMSHCGCNPEGNMSTADSEGSLEAAFALSAPPELPWLSQSSVMEAVRNRRGAEELVATVRAVSRPSQAAAVFSVASRQFEGRSYKVE
eukprot:14001203-Alexandrium_andersonii.AAC.1